MGQWGVSIPDLCLHLVILLFFSRGKQSVKERKQQIPEERKEDRGKSD